MSVGVEPVEGSGFLSGRSQEVVSAVDDVGVVPLQEGRGRAELVKPGGALDRDRDGHRTVRTELRGAAADHRPVDGAFDVEGDQLRGVRRRARGEGLLGVGALVHLAATAAVVPVELPIGGTRCIGRRRARIANQLQPLVDQVGACRGGAPRVMRPVAELDIDVGARKGSASGVEARPVQVLLVKDFRNEVADLWPEHGDRLPTRAVGGIDEQRVAHGRHVARDQGGKAKRDLRDRRRRRRRWRGLAAADVVGPVGEPRAQVGDPGQGRPVSVGGVHVREGLRQRRRSAGIVLQPQVVPDLKSF